MRVIKPMNRFNSQNQMSLVFVILALSVSLFFKLSLIGTGAPYTTIDDDTLFNAGFLVWFGEAPPQRMYLESWLTGATSIATYIYHQVLLGQASQLGLNLVADAFRDFQNSPSDYVLHYRYLMLSIDLLTAFFIYRLTALFFTKDEHHYWLVALPACMYLLTYNTLWCNLVARPDTMTAFFSVIGLYTYFKSLQGARINYLFASAIFLGCATGFKLHAAFFVIAIVIDLLRVNGIKSFITLVIPFGIIAIFLFCVTAGSPLFDPLLYIKLRALNIKDDTSPWIQQGDQFFVMLRGTGWLAIPLMLGALFLIIKQWRSTLNQNLKSLVLIASLFLLLFCSLRVLRGYWMLPALPLFYILAIYTVKQLPHKLSVIFAAVIICSVMAVQSFQQYQHFTQARYNELQTWIKANIKSQDTLYVVGFDILFLPKNTTSLQNRKTVLMQGLEGAAKQGENFTSRHIRLWEERAEVMLIDMLDTTSATGYNYYSLNSTPLEYLASVVSYEKIDFMFVMKGITDKDTGGLLTKIQNDFVKITEANAPGGKSGTGGLTYEIYARKHHAN
jgi:hypothetical protein